MTTTENIPTLAVADLIERVDKGDSHYIAEASSLRWAPGAWPVTVRLGGVLLRRTSLNQDGAMYRNDDGKVSVKVLND